MMTNSIIFQNVSLDDLRQVVKEELQAIAPTEPTPPPTEQQDEYLTRKETAAFLKISLTTIWELTKKGKLKPYTIGGSVRFKRTEIEKALKKGVL